MLLAESVEGKRGDWEGVREERGREFGRRETGGVEAWFWRAAGNEVFSFHPQKAECERTGPGSALLRCSRCL